MYGADPDLVSFRTEVSMPYMSCPNRHLTVQSVHPEESACPRCRSPLDPLVQLDQVREMQRSFAERESLSAPPRPPASPQDSL
jgi:hypothetical protein